MITVVLFFGLFILLILGAFFFFGLALSGVMRPRCQCCHRFLPAGYDRPICSTCAREQQPKESDDGR